MGWLSEFLAGVRAMGRARGIAGSLAVAILAFLAGLVAYLFVARAVLPALRRWAREEGTPRRGVQVALLLLLFLFPPLIYLRERGLAAAWYAQPLLALVLLAGFFVLVELGILLLIGALARAGVSFPTLFRDILRIALYFTALLVVARSVFGLKDLGALLGASAVFSIIIGLAVQDSVGNLFAGLFLQIDRPLKVGDWVLVSGIEGRVAEINWRSTRLVTRTNDSVSIPNNTISRAEIKNFTQPTTLHRVDKKVGVSYAAQPNKVKRVLGEAMREVDGVLSVPPPEAFLVEYGDFAVEYQLRYWIDDYGRLQSIGDEVMTAVWYQLRRHAISIPFPIRDVYLHRARPQDGVVQAEKVALLRKVDFLAPVPEAELLLLAEDLTLRLYAAGEPICAQGEAGNTFYVVWSGRVAVRARAGAGPEVDVAELERGSYFGEMSLLTGEPRSATVVAREDTELLELGRASFGQLLSSSPSIAESMSQILAVRLAATQAKVDEAEREVTRMVRRREDEVQSMTSVILSGIRGIFSFREK